MHARKDGFEDYTLSKDYGEHKAGDVIPVDSDRKAWLDENGYRARSTPSLTPAPPAPPPLSTTATAIMSPITEAGTPPVVPDLEIFPSVRRHSLKEGL